MDVHEKIAREIKDYLSANGITMTDVASRMGCSQQAISNQLSGRKIGENVARMWAKEFGFSLVYLMTGEGSLLPERDIFGIMPQERKKPSANNDPHTVPLLPIFAQAGSLTGWSEGIEEVKCERVISPVKDVDMAVHIYGESMYPDIPNGSVVYVRRINPRAFVEWGRPYILDTVNGPLLKYLTPGADEEHIRCVSANHDPMYAPFDVSKEDILGIYRVVMCMSMK